jgi:hypothetical protein
VAEFPTVVVAGSCSRVVRYFWSVPGGIVGLIPKERIKSRQPIIKVMPTWKRLALWNTTALEPTSSLPILRSPPDSANYKPLARIAKVDMSDRLSHRSVDASFPEMKIGLHKGESLCKSSYEEYHTYAPICGRKAGDLRQQRCSH